MDTARTRPLVEGALLAALVALLGLFSFYSGFGWLQPIPALLAYVRNGARNALLVATVGAGLLALWIGPLPALASLVFVAALGLAPGWAVGRGAGAGTTIAVMTLSVLCGAAAVAGAALLVWHANPWMDLWGWVQGFLTTHARLVRRTTGMPPSQLAPRLLKVAPVAAGLIAAVQAAGVYGLAAAVLRRLGHPLPAVPPFAAWRAPLWVVWPFAAGIAVMLWPMGKGPATAALNVTMAVGTVYSVVGFGVCYGWLRAHRLLRGTAALVLLGLAGLLGGVGLGAAPAALGLVSSVWARLRRAVDDPGTDEGESV